MTRLWQLIAQGLVYAAVAAGLAYGSAAPAYRRLAEDQAQITFTVVHGGQRLEDCRDRSAEELAARAPNMRKKRVCARRRAPVDVELYLDDRLVMAVAAPPGGLSGDGASRVYRRFAVPTGAHVLEARLRDSGRAEGFDHVRQVDVQLRPGQNLAVDYRPSDGGFVFE
ncbi:MAG: hypothetical protein SFV19_17195 [Rhodospirillaceae bacterium]|nr:hypothetical protein [Rhodospirillaceae bacterium]